MCIYFIAQCSKYHHYGNIDGERYRQNISPLELDGSHRTAGIITILIGGRTINYAVQQ